ncbi:MAG: hypothetical protein KME45_15540 [Stenomitos rutilans HA7619-LM2]|jgi:hypothetical protein|nr:hypothetical protein [Stenomitos rutilans HA7619-LM2]
MMRLLLRALPVVSWGTIVAAIVIASNQFTASRAITADPPRSEPPKTILPANLRETNIWTRALGTTKMPSPWRVAPCDSKSKAPLLCVYDQKTLVGTVEMGTFLLSSRADLKQKLTDAGIPAKANYADPQYRSRVLTALRAWVDDYYTTFRTDRASAYGKTITFTTQPPTQVTIGKLTGLHYSFAGLKQNKDIHERHIGYVAFDGSTLYVITTAFDATSETGKFKTLADFQRFEPHLAKLLPKLQLPIAASAKPSVDR